MPTDRQWPAADEIARLQREDLTRLLAALVRRFGDVDLAEDIAQEAMASALETWPRTGVPDSPLAWLMTTAKRKAIDVVRRDAVLARRLAELRIEEERRAPAAPLDSGADEIPDDRLELFFTCCHPLLRPDEQIALTLRFLGGLSTVEVAAAFLVPVPTMQARLTRAKKRIRDHRIPLTVPDAAELTGRLPQVLHVIYLIFNEGYAATTDESHVRRELTGEAIRLARIVAALVQDQPEALGLLALLLLTDARSPARTDAAGLPVALEDQDRGLWERAQIEEGLTLARWAATSTGAAGGAPGPYAIEASIAAVHAESPTFAATDWDQLVALYDLLLAARPGPVVELGRAVAVGRCDGMDVGLAQLDSLADSPTLQRSHSFHAARAVTLEELGRDEEAATAWATAAECATSPNERAYAEIRRRAAGRTAGA